MFSPKKTEPVKWLTAASILRAYPPLAILINR